MSNQINAEVLVREGIQHGGVAAQPATYPVRTQSEDQVHDLLLARLVAMQAELKAGNAQAAVKIGHSISGRAARIGERRVASLVRHAIVMSRFYILDQAGDLVAQAERELISKN
jgi:hypothetical protein